MGAVYRVIAKVTSTARIAAAIASGQKLSLGELSTGLYCRTLKLVPGMPGTHVLVASDCHTDGLDHDSDIHGAHFESRRRRLYTVLFAICDS